ncbi:hypothetical protein EDC01DRAFT_679399 [Geopyxis carbonaria]|nr:hypothetical protein EDC01DRAFT_679399 [Geopyxis carbonaria]
MRFSTVSTALLALIPAASAYDIWAYTVQSSECSGDWIGCQDLPFRTCCDWGYMVNTIEWDVPDGKTGYWYDFKHCGLPASMSRPMVAGECTYNLPRFQSNMYGDPPNKRSRRTLRVRSDQGVECKRPNTFGHRNGTHGTVDKKRKIPDGFWDEWDAEEEARGNSKLARRQFPPSLWDKLHALPDED